MRKAFAMLALALSALWAGPVLSAPSPTPELAAWVKSNTDLSVSQIAIVGAENVYSFEPVGPRLPTGEVLALVRTEALNPAWGDTHRFQSWDAHMLIDCEGGRVRVLRSASYPERDRQGPAKSEERGDDWFRPEAQMPAATLLAAACDANFNWPLRAEPATAPTKAAPLGGPSYLQVAAAGPASRPVRHASPVVAPVQAAQVATVERVALAIQQVSFNARPALQQPSAAPPQASASQGPKIVASAVAATRTCRRLADASRNWVMRRVELAFRRTDGPSRTDPGVIQQAALT